jgi:hypothetical protein
MKTLDGCSHARVPAHVVYRTFAVETVVLNLETGQYHGLNRTGGRMLDLLSQDRSISDAATRLADEYGRPPEEIERDLSAFCTELADRGLIELVANGCR